MYFARLNTIGIVELGRMIMVLAEGMAQRLKERKERFRAEMMAKGEAKGRAEVLAEVVAWNERRLAAEAKGEPFDEPPPGVEG